MIISPEDQKKIQEVARYAEAHPYGLADAQKVLMGLCPIPGNRPEHVVMLASGIPGLLFKVVYTVEIHPQEKENYNLWVRHFSFSAPRPGTVIDPVAVDFILEEFEPGLRLDQTIRVHEEHIGHNHVAINIWFKHAKSKDYDLTKTE